VTGCGGGVKVGMEVGGAGGGVAWGIVVADAVGGAGMGVGSAPQATSSDSMVAISIQPVQLILVCMRDLSLINGLHVAPEL
jgi:hypothetical protein